MNIEQIEQAITILQAIHARLSMEHEPIDDIDNIQKSVDILTKLSNDLQR